MKKIYVYNWLSLILCISMVQLNAQVDTSATSGHRSSVTSKQKSDVTDCCCKQPETTICGETTDDVHLILLDFKTKQMVLPKGRFKKGDGFQLRVVNFNPFLYKVVVNNTDSSVKTPNDGGMLPFFLDPSNISGLVANIISQVAPAPNPVTTQKFESLKGVQGTTENYSLIMSGVDLSPTIVTGTSAISKVKQIQGKERDIVEIYNIEIAQLRDTINERLFEFVRELKAYRNIYPGCDDFETTDAIGRIRRDLLPLIKAIATEKRSLSNAYNQYLVRTSPYRVTIANTAELKFADSLINLSYSLLVQDVIKMENTLSYKTVEHLMIQFETMAQASPCYLSLPIFMKRDVSNIKIAFQPRFDSTSLQPYQTEFSLPWMQHRIWGVSGGVYGSLLHNDAFAIQRNVTTIGGQSDTTYNIRTDNAGGGEFGINALAYTAWSISAKGPSYLGASFGAGLSVESKPRPRVFVGFSYVNGEDNRLLITLGAVTGFVNTLSGAYSTQTDYGQVPVDYIRDKVKANVFLSINYSFLH